MNRKIVLLFSLMLLAFGFQSNAQAPILGSSTLCVPSFSITLTSTDPGGVWTSSNTSIATVDGTGTVYSMSTLPLVNISGVTVITYTSIAGVATKTITVGTGPLAGPTAVCEGATITLSTGTPNGTWSVATTATAIGTIDASTGVFTGGVPAPGPMPVVVTYENSCGTAVRTVTVTPIPLPIVGNATSACVGNVINLSDPTIGGTWTSSNPTVATILTTGTVVTALAGGTSVINYSNGCGTATYTVTVNVPPGAITGLNSVCQGLAITLSNSVSGGTWTTDAATAVGTIDLNTGVFTAGVPTGAPDAVTVTYTNNCGISIYVVSIYPTTAPITGTISTLCTDQTTSLSDPTPGGTWTSTNTAVATILPTGTVVTAVGGGTTTIQYSNGCGTALYTMSVNVSPSPINGLSNFCLGSTGVLTSSPVGGTWSSANTLVIDINVSTGVLTGAGVGSTTVSYTLTSGCYAVFNVLINNCPACPANSDFELGNYSNWKYYTGTCCPGGLISTPTLATTPPAAGLIPCAFALTGPVGAPAPVVVTGTDPHGGFPVVGAGVYSLRIGSGRSNNWAEKAVYYVHVPPTGAYSLIYQYAVVTENPAGHNINEQPRFTVRAVNVTGVADTVNGGTVQPCANFLYVPSPDGTGLPGWTKTAVNATASCGTPKGGPGSPIWFKPWATTSINLSSLPGATIRMEFAAGGCDLGGHYAYGYVDMTCGTFAIANLSCGDTIATLTAPSGFANYRWVDSLVLAAGGSGAMGTTQTITFPMPIVPTTYAVIMTPFVGFGCPDTLYTTISPSNLQLHPKADTMICLGQSANISVNATDIVPISYQWTPTTGLSCATCANPVVTPFAGVNVYSVIVVNDAGCEKSGTQRVTVDSVAITTAATATSCFGFSDGTATATTTSGRDPFAYSWTTVPAQVASTAIGLSVGVYSVTVTDSLGCTTTGNATVNQPPPLNMSIAGSVNPDSCGVPNGSITLGGGFTTGDTFVIKYLYTATGTTTTVAVTGTYTATPTITISGLGQGIYDSIQIIPTGCPYNTLGPIPLTDPAPPAAPYVNSNSPVCVGQPINFTTSSTTGGVTYAWSGPGGFTSAVQTPSISVANLSHAGWYVVEVMKDLCTSKDSTRVIIVENPIPFATNNSPKCSGTDTLKFTSGNSTAGSGDSYLWNGPDAFMSTFQNPIIIRPAPTAAGVYTVTVTRDGCSMAAATTVTVHPTPAPPDILDTNYCQGAIAVPLSATGDNILWFTSLTSVGVTAPPTPNTAVPNITTWYATQTSNTVPACESDKAVVTVGVYALPEPKFNITDSVFCEGTYFTFTVNDENTGADYQGLTWNFGSDIVQDVNPVLHSFSEPGIFNVTVNVNYKVCPDAVMTHVISVYPYPSLQLGDDTAICPGSQSLEIGDSKNELSGTARWIWNTGEKTAKINVVAPGTYYVKVTMAGCSTSDTILVANDCYMNMPNVFTPNGDGVNDFFFPRQYLTRGLTSFGMTIYNRWGQVVFKSNSIEGRGWDGTFNDVPQPQGVFIYVIDATFKDGQKEHHQGNITLLR